MKKHLSVLSFWIRTVFPSVLLLTALTAAGNACAALFAIRQSLAAPLPAGFFRGLEESFASVPLPFLTGAGFLLLTVVLCLAGTSFSSRAQYTVSRLQIQPNTVFLWQAGCYALCYLFFWAVNGTVLAGCALGYQAGLDGASPQTAFLALYRVPFLHSLVPMNDGLRLLRNLLFCTMLGTSAALFSARHRSFRPGFAGYLILLLTGYVLFVFPGHAGQLTEDVLRSGIALLMTVLLLVWDGGLHRILEDDPDYTGPYTPPARPEENDSAAADESKQENRS